MKQKNKTRLARAAMTLLLALLTTFGAWAETVTFDFEDNAIPSDWTNDATYPWVVTETSQGDGHLGTYCIKSGNSGVNSSESSIEATFTFVGDGSISFLGGCWGEGSSWDVCVFYIDGEQQFSYGNRDTWETYSFDVEAGTHTFKWTFKKDSSVAGTGDAFFIDNVVVDLGTASACSKPTGLSVALTPGNGTVAALSWTETGEATNWVLEYGTAADFTGATSVNVTGGTPSKTLTGLTAETTYYARVKANCGGGDESSWSNVVTFTPTNTYSITVNDGTNTNGYVPFYGYYADSDANSQFIIPASALSSMEWGTINKITFYGSTASATWNGAVFDIYFSEVSNTEFESAALVDWSNLDSKVYTGSVSVVDNKMELTLTAPYQYMGGNLLIGFDETTNSSNYPQMSWYGVTQTTNTAVYKYSSYAATLSKFLPKVTFDYTPGVAPTCPKPKNLAASNVTNHTATLTWTAGEEETQWTVEYGKNSDFTGAQTKTVNTNPTVGLTGLDAETVYYARVKANCSVDDASEWTDAISFETLVACAAPTNLAAGNITATSAEISWTGNADATSYNLRYRTPKGFNYGFETAEPWAVDDFAPCTTYDGDGKVTYSFNGNSFTNQNYTGACIAFQGDWSNGAHPAHSGNAFGAMFNPSDGSTANDWLILPEITIQSGDVFSFWCRELTEQYGSEEIKVGVCGSTDGTFASYLAGSDTETLEISSATWTQYSYDLSDYVGQNIKLAINCVSTDIFALFIDDIFVGNPNDDTWDETLTNVTSPKELTGLTPSTAYEVEVQAVNAEGTSTWVGTHFTTLEDVPRPSDLAVSDISSRTAKLNWTENGEATAWEISLNDDETNLIAADSKPFTLPDLTPETQYSVKVRAIKGEKKSGWSSSITFTTDIACPAPTELAADNITSTTAEIIWNADPAATGFELQYAERPAVTGTSVLSYDDGTYATGIGNSSVGTWTWGVMYPGSMVTATALNKVSIYESSSNTGDITINVYQGGDDAPGTLLYTETVASKAADGFHEVILSSPVALTAEQNLWITLTETGTYVMSACSVDNDNNQWVYDDGAWANIGTLASSLAGYGWMIRAEIGTAASTELIWSNSEDATSPYEMSGLTPGSTYVVRVKALYDEEGSDWASTIFTTDALAPTDLIVSNILSSSATISWTGYCDTYNVFLGTDGNPINLLSVDFEDQDIPADFTNDETYPWEVVAGNNGYCIQSSNAGVASSTSAISVSKTFTKDGTIEFDAECKGEGTSTAWDQCIFSIDGTAKFSYGANVNGWNHYSFPVSAGEHTFTWSYAKDSSVNPTGDYFAVDNIVMNESDINWSDTPIEVTETECALTGLTPNTTYYVQVVGVIGENNYESGIVSFTTLESVIINFAAEGYATYYNSARDVVLPEGMKALVVTDGNTTLTYAPIADGDTDDNVVPAATAMLLQVEPSRGDQEKTITLTTPTATPYAGTNLLHGSDVDNTETFGGAPYYKLTYSNNNDNFGWYWGADNGEAFSSPAHKAWLALGSSGAPSFLGLPDWDTTGIVPVSVNPEDGEWYTLQGMKVGKKPTTAGVYIHNGRKVLIP